MVIRDDIKKKNQVKLATYQSWVISYILNSPPSLLISFSGATPTLLFSAYLLKRWTTCNHLKLTETSWNHPQTTWNQSYYSNFLLKIKYSLVALVMILHPKVLFGQIWSPRMKFFKLTKIWYRGTLLYPSFEFNVYFSKIFVIHEIWSSPNWNLVEGYIAICLLRL